MIGYISLVRDNGKRAFMRSDEIAAFAENTTKVDGKEVPCLTVMLRNNVSWHFPHVKAEQMLAMMRGVTGGLVQVQDESNCGIPGIGEAA